MNDNGNDTQLPARVPDIIRRRMLRAMVAAPAIFATSGLFTGPWRRSALAETPLTPTPACDDDDDEPTESQTEGPFFTPSSPRRTSLIEEGIAGTPLILVGTVLTRSCRPVAGALVDFWQADDAGQYDNRGFRLRGHQFTDAKGVYRLETIVPGPYPGRTRHLHVKVQAPAQRILTTQLYFPGEARNARDRIYDADLLMAMPKPGLGGDARFDFVLDLP
jgi:protocatechuate 3,4-dioxygenase beta subunit